MLNNTMLYTSCKKKMIQYNLLITNVIRAEIIFSDYPHLHFAVEKQQKQHDSYDDDFVHKELLQSFLHNCQFVELAVLKKPTLCISLKNSDQILTLQSFCLSQERCHPREAKRRR